MTIYYVADPPQWARLSGVVVLSAPYQVGDRISFRDATYSDDITRTYECIQAGTSGAGYFSPTSLGVGNYTWGTTVWTVVQPTSWAKAATTPIYRSTNSGVSDVVINYIDYAMQSTPVDTGEYNDLNFYSRHYSVFVNPQTMQPMNQQRIIRIFPTNAYFGLASSYYSKLSLNSLYTHSSVNTDASYDVTNGVLKGDPSNNYTYYMFGGSVYADNPSVVNITFGVDLTPSVGITFRPISSSFPVPSFAANAPFTAINSHSDFTPANKASYEATSNTASIARSHLIEMWTPYRYFSFANTSNPKSQLPGQGCTYIESSDCYRAAGFAAWETPYALRVAWSQSPNFYPDMSRPVFAPTILVQNTLTGARTVNLRFYTDCPIPLTDLDVWIEVFAATSTTTLEYTNATTMNANYGAPWATGTALTTEAGWTEVANVFQGTGYRISRTVTINKATPVIVRLVVASNKFYYSGQINAIPGFRMYVDPNIEVV